MKALVYHKPKDVRVDTVEDPKLRNPQDIIIRVTSSAICGSDLHIFNGLFPQLRSMTLGHEFMGVVEEKGSDVASVSIGDRVVVPFPIGCGTCYFCRLGLTTHCENSNPEHYGPEGAILKQKGGGLYGYTDLYGGYDGGQAEYARVLWADFNVRKVPDGVPDDRVLFLTDIFPTGWAAVKWAELSGGETVAVFGCGPVGLMAMKSAWLQGAGRVIGIDIVPYRLEAAKAFAGVETIDASETDPVEVLREMTEGRGADVCIDAVGMEAHRSILDKAAAAVHLERGSIDVLRTALSAVRRGGKLSVVGVYATTYDNFPFGQLFDKQVRITLGQAMVQRYIDDLMQFVLEDKVRPEEIITHRLSLDEAAHGYDIFSHKQDGCVKVVLKP